MTSLLEKVLSKRGDPLSQSLLAVLKRCGDNPKVVNLVYAVYKQYATSD